MIRIEVPLPGREYPILIGAGGLDRAGELLALARWSGAAVVTEGNLAGHLPRLEAGLGRQLPTLSLPAEGESLKRLATLETVLEFLRASGLDRGGVVLAFGGGVVGDLAGFAAATYLRGVDVIQLPTTLLAMVDSAIGGKTGVNLPAGKNLVGAFHQPRAVLIDPTLLETLPERELAAGMAEVVKYGLIEEVALFERLERDGPLPLPRGEALIDNLAACCRVKAEVVAADETEGAGAGRSRRILNFGHTLGHALEAVTGYRHYKHGEAVAIGMSAAVELSRLCGRLEPAAAARARALIERLPVPAPPEGLDRAAVLTATRSDKKRLGGQIHWVLLEAIGRTRITTEVTDARVARALDLAIDRTSE